MICETETEYLSMRSWYLPMVIAILHLPNSIQKSVFTNLPSNDEYHRTPVQSNNAYRRLQCIHALPP